MVAAAAAEVAARLGDVAAGARPHEAGGLFLNGRWLAGSGVRPLPSAAGLLIEINVGELLSAMVAHDKGRANVLDRPRRREAAGGHKRQWFK